MTAASGKMAFSVNEKTALITGAGSGPSEYPPERQEF
jgi:hypothetical protein